MTKPQLAAAVLSLGGVLQLAGVWLVAWEIHQAHKEFAPEKTRRIRNWFRRTFGKAKEHQLAVSDSILLQASTDMSIATYTEPAALSLEEKVDQLFEQDKLRGEQIEALRRDAAAAVAAAQQTLQDERQQRADDDQQLHDAVVRVATGGVRIRVVGIVLLTAGIVLATWADWTAGIFL